MRAELLTANEWEYFVANGEDLGGDRSADVVEWLRPLVDGFGSRARKVSRELESEVEEYGLAATLLRTRWDQIGDACVAFCEGITT